jgi:acetyltransferase-like isoleucine patch superfamily enzyme
LFEKIIKVVDRLEFLITKNDFFRFSANNQIGSNCIFYAIRSNSDETCPKIIIGNNIYIGHHVSIHSIKYD